MSQESGGYLSGSGSGSPEDVIKMSAGVPAPEACLGLMHRAASDEGPMQSFITSSQKDTPSLPCSTGHTDQWEGATRSRIGGR